jgi:hypothetical protein
MSVISASRRTDIPAFYTEWLIRRLIDTYCWVQLPYGGGARRVDLRPEAVDAWVFWSKDFSRFFNVLDRAEALGHHAFVFHYTINDAPRVLEPRTPEAALSADVMQRLAERGSIDSTVWRFDPIVLTERETPELLLARFERLAGRLAGATRRVTTSFVDRYAKTDRNMLPALSRHAETAQVPTLDQRREMVTQLSVIANKYGMELRVCAEPDLIGLQVPAARCVDPDQISTLLGKPLSLPRRPTRTGCGCHASIDIGAYNTCINGCVYCYANSSPSAALKNHATIDPANPALCAHAITPPKN